MSICRFPMMPLFLALGSFAAPLAETYPEDRLREPGPPPDFWRGSGRLDPLPLKPRRCSGCNEPLSDWQDRCAACRAKTAIDFACPRCKVAPGVWCQTGRKKRRKALHSARVDAAGGGR